MWDLNITLKELMCTGVKYEPQFYNCSLSYMLKGSRIRHIVRYDEKFATNKGRCFRPYAS